MLYHLENGNRVYFTEGNLAEKLSNLKRTALTSFFELCKTNEFAKTLLYCYFPQYFTWNKSTKIFIRRKRGENILNFPGIKKLYVLGRVYTIAPSNVVNRNNRQDQQVLSI